jgi:hypothetical protein
MSEISIHIGWEYFLGVIGTLIGIAYYTNGRLTRLETTVDWVKDTLTRLSAKFEAPTETREQRQSVTPVGRKASGQRRHNRIPDTTKPTA